MKGVEILSTQMCYFVEGSFVTNVSHTTGLMPFLDLVLGFEEACRNASDSHRYESSGRHRVIEDKLMSLNFYEFYFGHLAVAGYEELPHDLTLSPTTSPGGMPSHKIADQDVGKHETLYMQPNCSNLKCLLPICTDWEVCSRAC
ncbi:hypothetical protein MKW98_024530 [Papaver atlanticum]|uniref:Uncharacterized protein n=1 Tax=Papaver atlanticum TaxID=357466 RepID=A0AAD4X485_9MAGN|nr:hypothetical protein MKW98_024530 [Papaver atlanticum]